MIGKREWNQADTKLSGAYMMVGIVINKIAGHFPTPKASLIWAK